ncbi:MAG: L,D-transpeptidase [Beijerinckiaceae bacterium]|jgi:lipoprotein-anchoring transpeptidase ErfK/SrfK
MRSDSFGDSRPGPCGGPAAPVVVALAALGALAALSAPALAQSRWQEGYVVHGLAAVGEPGRERVQPVSRWTGSYGGGAVYNAPEPAFAPQPAQPAPRRMAFAPAAGAAAGAADALALSRGGVDPAFLRQEVPYAGKHRPGTIVIDTPSRYLYLVQPGGRAIRYGIGVGRPGFEWSGVKRISRKAEWPDWTPPPEMLKRRPDLPRFMKGGPDNPLGARALYLGSSLYRIHGTNEPWTIGQNVSSGCIRMMNEDVEDLYGRVRLGATVVVM